MPRDRSGAEGSHEAHGAAIDTLRTLLEALEVARRGRDLAGDPRWDAGGVHEVDDGCRGIRLHDGEHAHAQVPGSLGLTEAEPADLGERAEHRVGRPAGTVDLD